ncbi:hypothetical protein V1520DRAFT_334484 [Lipomyces starkeyi]|uniref:ADP-ribosylation factor GTPase-activating protein n=1 Tax=Lipomyces starkeyi NRRL Y-11557 TaxID=675824 RepID=A0A1E3Q8P2_LIPST|nr:hypothetical protein LIPSTDRAFT_70541 [Lipomyces starkeyi NRRL Y-11557]
MGAIASRPDETGSVYLADQARFTITNILIQNLDGQSILRISPMTDGRTAVLLREDSSPMVEFVQDLEPQSITPILPKLLNEGGLVFRFSLLINKANFEGLSLNGLTFLSSTNNQALDVMLTEELQSDPNMQNRENVVFIGDYTSTDAAAIELDWTWTWKPPSDINDRFNGWRNTCCFAEYSKRDHKLNILARFSFWVQDTPKSMWTIPPSPRELIFAQFRSPSSVDDTLSPLELLPSVRLSNDLSLGDPAILFFPETKPGVPPSNDSASVPVALGSVPATAPVACVRPAPDDLSQPEDGPLFRATVASLEKKTASMKNLVKHLLKRAIQAYDAQAHYCESYAAFLDNLRDTANGLPSFQPPVDHYFNVVGRDLLRFERQSCIDLQTFVIEPLRRLYDVDIKAADAKKREFEDESREYYSWLSRYLSTKYDAKGKKKTESNSKYQDKRKNFELKRFDYYSYIQDLHGGRKEQEVSYQLSAYTDALLKHFLVASKAVQLAKPQVDSMVWSMKKNREAWSIRRTEREERRRALEMSSMPEPVMAAMSAAPTAETGPGHRRKQSEGTQLESRDPLPPLTTTISANSAGGYGFAVSPSQQQRFKGIREIEEKDGDSDAGRRKEGLLWAMSRPEGHSDPRNLNKPGWHKFWVVLAGGQLCEYSNWKQSLELHNDPINLKMATVREARSTDRRFCFEVITPQYRRIYQATSEEDMFSWINVISNAITSTLEGRGSMREVPPFSSDSSASSAPSGSADALFTKPPTTPTARRVSPMNGNTHKQTRTPRIYASDDNDDAETGTQPLSAVSSNSQNSTLHESTETLIHKLRDADPNNSICADCGATAKVEWVSINLMVILCIECSGLHRSLGTHISKVRSLTLDTVSFTPDLVDALLSIGNTKANSVWEAMPSAVAAKATLLTELASNQQTPVVQQAASSTQLMQLGSAASASSRQARLKFITKKYVDRAFVAPVPQPNMALRSSVKGQDILEVLRALAFNADCNANTLVSSSESSSSSSSLSSSIAPAYPIFMTALVHAPKDSQTFPIAEILVQHGTRVPNDVPPEVRLSGTAADYLYRKSGRKTVDVVPSTPVVSSSEITSGSPVTPISLAANDASRPSGQSLPMQDQLSRLQRKLSVGSSRLHAHTSKHD